MTAIGAQASTVARAARPAWSRVRRVLDFLVRAPRRTRRHQPYGPLSVGELIAQLRRFDPDMRVIMPGETEDWTEVHEAHLDIFSPQPRHPQRLQLADDGDKTAILMVRLFGDPDPDPD
ncbi:hypothetical protein [Caulobacter sp.]|jgi:hypothetical protein|uniref:hypothetical protein n=1 Tax=Caulobacter sp. TaxID=78 RepID=UPI0031DFAA28